MLMVNKYILSAVTFVVLLLMWSSELESNSLFPYYFFLIASSIPNSRSIAFKNYFIFGNADTRFSLKFVFQAVLIKVSSEVIFFLS